LVDFVSLYSFLKSKLQFDLYMWGSSVGQLNYQHCSGRLITQLPQRKQQNRTTQRVRKEGTF